MATQAAGTATPPPADQAATTGLGDDDETTLYGSLPADFWSDDLVTAEAAAEPDSPDAPEATEPAGSGTAFAELQELFPGRVLEVTKDATVPPAGAEFDTEEQAPDEDDEGYDDPDQSRISFGPEN